MFTLIFKDGTGKIYEVKSSNIFKIWYIMGKYLTAKYQLKGFRF